MLTAAPVHPKKGCSHARPPVQDLCSPGLTVRSDLIFTGIRNPVPRVDHYANEEIGLLTGDCCWVVSDHSARRSQCITRLEIAERPDRHTEEASEQPIKSKDSG